MHKLASFYVQSKLSWRFNWKKETYIEAAFGRGLDTPFDLRERRAHTLKYFLRAWSLHLAKKDSNFLFFFSIARITSFIVLRLGRFLTRNYFNTNPELLSFLINSPKLVLLSRITSLIVLRIFIRNILQYKPLNFRFVTYLTPNLFSYLITSLIVPPVSGLWTLF